MTRITGKQKSARRRNMAIARNSKKKSGSKKKITINQASKALAKKGFSLSRGKTDLGTMTTSYRITSVKTGRHKRVSAKKIIAMMG